jgi:phosphatidylserine decarboxylase
MVKKQLYDYKLGRLILESFVKRKPFTAAAGKFANNRASKMLIPWFKKTYKIDIANFLTPQGGFKTLNQFFTRNYKPEYLNFPTKEGALFTPAEGYLSIQENINANQVIQAKEFNYSLSELIGQDASEFNNGVLIKLRLTPKEYHHFHYFDNGKLISFSNIAGSYYTSDNCGLDKIKKLYTKSHRQVSMLQTKNFGKVAYIEIGATFVGTIIQNNIVGEDFKAGDKKGCFKFGGSTAILLFKKNTIKLNKDILQATKDNQEVYVNLFKVIGSKI